MVLQNQTELTILPHNTDNAKAHKMQELGFGELGIVRKVVVNEVHELFACWFNDAMSAKIIETTLDEISGDG